MDETNKILINVPSDTLLSQPKETLMNEPSEIARLTLVRHILARQKTSSICCFFLKIYN